MKLLPAAALLACVGLASLDTADASAGSNLAAIGDPVEMTGTPAAWRISMSGDVLLRLDGEEDAQVWFLIRPDTIGGVAVEDLMLDAILHAEQNDLELTVVGEKERALSGESPDEALPLVYLARN